MYDVRLNGRTATSVPSYEKAVAASKSSLSVVVENVRERAAAIVANPRLYRSPKARRNVAAAMLASAERAIASVKFPKKAGDVSVNIADVNLAIIKV